MELFPHMLIEDEVMHLSVHIRVSLVFVLEDKKELVFAVCQYPIMLHLPAPEPRAAYVTESRLSTNIYENRASWYTELGKVPPVEFRR